MTESRKIGRGMLWLAALGLLGMLTLAFDRVLDHQQNPNSSPGSRTGAGFVEVALAANRQNHYVASALINGQEAVVLLDTGATQVAISEPLARRLGLPRGSPMQIATANGIATAYSTRVTSIRLGQIEVRDVSAKIVPNMTAPDVLLGMNFLKDLEMTQRDGQLMLRQYQ